MTRLSFRRLKANTVKRRFRKPRKSFVRPPEIFAKLAKNKKIILFVVALAVIAATVVCVTLSPSLSDAAVELARAEVECNLRKCVNSAISKYFAENPSEKLYNVNKNVDGELSSITLDAAKANKFKATVAEYVNDELDKTNAVVRIPAGSLTDNIFLSGKGGKIKIHIMSASYVSCDISSSLASAGVNQALHEVFVTVTVGATSRVGKICFNTTAEEKLIISQTLVVGKIPDSFASFSP